MADKPALSAHNEVTIQAPPGAAFMFWGTSLILRFERGREREIFQWFANWNQQQIFPLVLREEARARGVQPDYSGINAGANTPPPPNGHAIAASPAEPSALPESACPMGCGTIIDAHGKQMQNVNPACPTHGNPDALYGRVAPQTTEETPEKPEGT